MHEFDLTDPEQRNQAAGEYVLGTLEREEKARFEALMAVSPDLQAEVEQWREHLDLLNRSLEPVKPPPALWQRIQRQTAPRRGFWQRSWPWASALSLGLVLAIGLWVQQALPPQDYYVYLVPNERQKPGWMVNTSMDRNQLVVQSLRPVDMPRDKFYELWLMIEGREPVTLGFLPASGELRIPIRPEWRELLPHSDLVVTMEGPDGAPSGYNMGPVSDKAQWLRF